MASRSYDKVADICDQIMLQIASQGLAFQDEWSFVVHLLGHIYLNDLQLVAAGGNDMKQCLDKETPMVLCLHGQLMTKTAAIGVESCATNNQVMSQGLMCISMALEMGRRTNVENELLCRFVSRSESNNDILSESKRQKRENEGISTKTNCEPRVVVHTTSAVDMLLSLF
ncbi:hypothetical protein Lser_V15G18390 [Lactuca serriola]